ncbi:hypothetical protein M5K25_009228 [Dendrobium thyrsiflorum]|uniref:Uncharacterized protein n=1 Tax=Dendrobium thyrsiflorum TaxID=117978 RepID=A0ABD0V4Y9_DENTH
MTSFEVLQEPEARILGGRVVGGITQRFAARLLQQIRNIPIKQMIQEKSTRLKESLAILTDESLEAKERCNEIFGVLCIFGAKMRIAYCGIRMLKL